MDHLTKDLPGTGGLLKAAPEDFLVEEIPAYLPAGEGEHTFLFIEKRALTTQEALAALCRALSVREADAGVAGQKDRQAITRQWLSLPRVDPAAASGLDLQVGGGSVRVLSAARHGNKLRTGHLRGNRFTLVLREAQEGLARAGAVMAALQQRGVPNRYGAQRFGARGRNADDGRRLCLGELRVHDRLRRRFLVSAYQAALFNRYLGRRQDACLLTTVLPGDVLQKRETGGIFTAAPEAEELAAAQARVGAGEVAITGPIFGSRMHAPPEGTLAGDREAELLLEEGLSRERFQALGAICEGTRRPLLVPLTPLGDDLPLVAPHPDDPAAVVLRFALPPGSYATVVMEEVMKQELDLSL